MKEVFDCCCCRLFFFVPSFRAVRDEIWLLTFALLKISRSRPGNRTPREVDEKRVDCSFVLPPVE